VVRKVQGGTTPALHTQNKNETEKKMENRMENATGSGGKEKEIICESGRIYYRGNTERRVYFVLTIIMLVLGILYKTGMIG
jgi:hypothetical protein